MLLIALVGWTIVLPILVVSGLYAAARVLGARASRRNRTGASGVVRELEGLSVQNVRRDRTTVPSRASEARDPVKLGA